MGLLSETYVGLTIEKLSEGNYALHGIESVLREISDAEASLLNGENVPAPNIFVKDSLLSAFKVINDSMTDTLEHMGKLLADSKAEKLVIRA